ncbi:uncharacterized protein ARB_04943 [Trichophyton benhamiae CBS 112371]|uniref:Nickel/cobalt efflux system n=1 Tax=Arthroderma benhamiae (strain ATCC MYA-4681 / CBS 112371) TaxID=663331 RepID=D4AKU8_ARTBC|nr:uncharacterized protein ARB_04943 [Trichophyton benhamiae CBS 112371]EFE36007.1 hypothetical protein ARB_04943 [Trichophyton benhamiae CBS 112371]
MPNASSAEEQLLTANRDKKPRWSIIEKAERSHRRVPGLRKIPLPALAIIFFIALINILVWIAAGIVLHQQLLLHIALVYVMLSMRTIYHIVIITSIVVAATAAAVSDKFDKYGSIGGIIGSSVSSAFLILLGIMNGYILYKLVLQMKKVLRDKNKGEEMWKIEGGGVLFSILKGMFKIIDRPWKMYPLGVLFGLGFDTSSEIALLGISSVQASKGTSIWLILILPILFTAGMCLIDTIDGALMLSLYVQPAAHFLDSKSQPSAEISAAPIPPETPKPQSTPVEEPVSRNPRDPVAFLYYSIVLTSLTVVVAIVIGVIQLLTLLLNALKPHGKFWDGVQVAGDYYDVIGGAICGLFIIFGGISVLVYPQWRRWAGKNQDSAPSCGHHVRAQADEESRIDGLGVAATNTQSLSQAGENPVDGPKTGTAADTKLV